jgi:hypothetical protein
MRMAHCKNPESDNLDFPFNRKACLIMKDCRRLMQFWVSAEA